MITHVHKVMNTCWCWHICEGDGVWAVEMGLGPSAGFKHFCGDEMLIFHCAEGWNRKRSHGGDRRCFPSDRHWVWWRQTPVPHLVLCPRWRAVFSVWRTLVSGATDTDVSVWWLTLVCALLKEAIDAVVLKRRMRLLQLRALGAYWTRLLVGIDRWRFDRAGHVACIRATDTGCHVCHSGNRRVWCPRKTPSEGATTIFVCGAINRSGGQPWLVLGTLGT
jgi:hypothetical protein